MLTGYFGLFCLSGTTRTPLWSLLLLPKRTEMVLPDWGVECLLVGKQNSGIPSWWLPAALESPDRKESLKPTGTMTFQAWTICCDWVQVFPILPGGLPQYLLAEKGSLRPGREGKHFSEMLIISRLPDWPYFASFTRLAWCYQRDTHWIQGERTYLGFLM